MSTRRALAAVVVSAALGLFASAPAHGVLIPDPGPRPPVGTEAPRDADTPRTPETSRDSGAPVETVVDPMTHLEALQAIAEAHDGTRAAGTAGHEASASYVERKLAAAGYDPWRQYFSFIYEETLSSSLTYTVAQRTASAAHIPMAQSPGTPTDGVTGVLVAPTAATGCNADDWADVDATDGIAVVVRGSCTFADKAQTAADAGAAALIVHNSTAGTLNGALGGQPDQHIPTVGVTEETGRTLSGLPDGAVVTVTVDKVIEERQTFTVLAETDGERQDSVVMLGAHLDGGDEGPGINDNGSGSAALLETAVHVARTGQTTSPVRFAWWGASELGNLGSRHYVTQLADEDPESLGRIASYLDVDTVASPNHIVAVHDAGGRPGSVLGDHLDSIGQAWVDTSAPAESDARAFIEAGVPSTGLSTGTSGGKTAQESKLFGGTVGLPYDPNHDTVADDIDNVDVDVLRMSTAAVAHAATTLASRP